MLGLRERGGNERGRKEAGKCKGKKDTREKGKKG